METTMTGVKYQPLEGRPLPRACCYGNVPPSCHSLSPGFSSGGKVGPGLGLASMTRKHPLPDKSNLQGTLQKLLGTQSDQSVPSTGQSFLLISQEPHRSSCQENPKLGFDCIRITQRGFKKYRFLGLPMEIGRLGGGPRNLIKLAMCGNH